MAGAQAPTRPYDALYDNTYTVSGPRDHYRQQTSNIPFTMERHPVFPNMFSEMGHHPSNTYMLKTTFDPPEWVDRGFNPEPRIAADLTLRSNPRHMLAGRQPLFVRRPLNAGLMPLPHVHFASSDTNTRVRTSDGMRAGPAAPAAPAPAAPAAAPPPMPLPMEPSFGPTRDFGTQSDYRENEAQTGPWECPYVLPNPPSLKQQVQSERFHCDGPEVLQLAAMKFELGALPGGKEVALVEKLRARRAEEAALPGPGEPGHLAAKAEFIRKNELEAWAERDDVLAYANEVRLARIEAQLAAREAGVEAALAARLEALKTRAIAGKAEKFAAVQAARTKEVHHLAEARKQVGSRGGRTGLVAQYADYGSSLYAPIQRDGKFPDSRPKGQEIATSTYQPVGLSGLNELEASMPRRLVAAAPPRPDSTGTSRRTRRVAAEVIGHLEHVNGLLATSKASLGRGYGECWPFPLPEDGGSGGVQPTMAQSATIKRVATRKSFRFVERTETASVAAPDAGAAQRAALVLLQRLLRGRAAQDRMYVGRARRLELIRELQLAETCRAHGRRPEDLSSAAHRADVLVGHAVSELCAVLVSADAVARERLLADLATRAAAYAKAQQEAEEAAAAAAEEARHANDPDLAALEAERIAKEEVEAAAKMEAIQRGRIARAHSQAATKAAEEAAEAARAQQRHPLVDIELSPELEAAAVKIQAVHRGRQTRKQVNMLKDTKEKDKREAAAAEAAARPEAPPEDLTMFFTDDMEAAALKIQAMQRGRQARRRVGAIRAGANVGLVQQESLHAHVEAALPALSQAAVVLLHEESLHGAIKAEALAEVQASTVAADTTGAADDLAASLLVGDAELEAAAVKIQAVQRGRVARRRAAEMAAMQGPAMVQHVTVKAADGHEVDAVITTHADGTTHMSVGGTEAVDIQSTPETEAAALRIQAAARGRAARKQVAAMKAPCPAESDEQAPQRPPNSPEAAASPAPLFDAEMEAAALRIQAAQRGRAARKEVAAMKAQATAAASASAPAPAPAPAAPAADAVKAAMAEALPDDFEVTPEMEAVTLRMQAARQRRLASRKQLQEKQANVLHAPITAAVVEKAASADKQLLDALAAEQEKAALRIQAAARGRAARTHVKALRAELTPQQQADEAAAAAAAASMVPEGVDLERLDEPIVVDALLQEGELVLQKTVVYDEEHEAAIRKIQAAQRGRAARKEVAAMKAEAEAKAAAEKAAAELAAAKAAGVAQREYDEAAAAAALKIQSVQRGREARKRVGAMRQQAAEMAAGNTQ